MKNSRNFAEAESRSRKPKPNILEKIFLEIMLKIPEMFVDFLVNSSKLPGGVHVGIFLLMYLSRLISLNCF